ncbi:Zinc finger protein 595 [Papilio xuthus]|uniref:Zinc finger protein 595 n=1 Tax=Papilio xuthus TaxID=66420 RepID=A0A194Q758_PAPXU|nr:Zinc finger protein 595 [Papilio xuthus]
MKILDSFIKNLDRQVQDINTESINKIFISMNQPEHKIIEEKSKPSINKSKKIFNCIKCDIKFISNDLLQEHKNSFHKKSEATICDVCGQKLKSPTSLKAHINCHKVKECPYCFKTLKCHSHYNIHIKRHTSNVKRKRNKLYYTCNNCNYQSLNKKTLEAHINRIHLHIRPYVCETCDKGFYKNSHLTEHVKIHLQIKNKTCEVCGEHFVNEKTLIEHQRLHSDDKPYECNICMKRFVTSGRRSDHIKRSHMEKTESCIFCDKKYSLRKELNRHIKKSHNEIPLNIDNNFDINISNYKFDDSILPIS